MDNILEKLCMGCMEPLTGKGDCPYCGFNIDQPQNPDFLPPGTPLDNRYFMGKLENMNGEGGTYVGYDTNENERVWVKEYFPGAIAKRNRETHEVMPRSGHGAQYKALLSDFLEISNEVRKLASAEPIVSIENIIGDNNTVYVIYHYIESLTLEEYIISQGGQIELAEALEMIMPVLNVVDNMHVEGVIHRGLSPYTIIVDHRGKLYVSGFALGATRTGGSELKAELFSGYSAPEQYASTGWQGTWTDVYALAAIFYRMVTGIVLPKSTRISPGSPIVPLNELIPGVGANVSTAVSEALQISAQSRTQTVAAFLSSLFAEEGATQTAIFDISRIPSTLSGGDLFSPQSSGSTFAPITSDTEPIIMKANLKEFTPVFAYDSYADYDAGADVQSGSVGYEGEGYYEEPPKKKNITWLIILLVVVFVVSLAAIFTIIFSGRLGLNIKPSFNESSNVNVSDLAESSVPTSSTEQPVVESSETSEEVVEKDTKVRNFVGQSYEEIAFNPLYKDVYHFEKVEEYSSTHEKGIVSSQSALVGTTIPTKGITLVLTISKGSLELIMPDLLGKELEEAKQELRKLAKSSDVNYEDFEIREVPQFSSTIAVGHIINTDPIPAATFELSDIIHLYVSQDTGQSSTGSTGTPITNPSSSNSSDSSASSSPPTQDDDGRDLSPNDPHKP